MGEQQLKQMVSITDLADFPAQSLLAIYHYIGYQLDDLQNQKEALANLRLAVIGRYHELTPDKDES